jgi:hypothetical protein
MPGDQFEWKVVGFTVTEKQPEKPEGGISKERMPRRLASFIFLYQFHTVEQ